MNRETRLPGLPRRDRCDARPQYAQCCPKVCICKFVSIIGETLHLRLSGCAVVVHDLQSATAWPVCTVKRPMH